MLTLQKFSGMLTNSLKNKEMNNYKIYLAMMILFLGISSCTKEDGIYTENGSSGIVELADLVARTSSTAYATSSKSFAAQVEVDCPIVVNYTGADAAPEDVTVTFALDPTIVNAMTTTAVPLSVLDPALYTVPTFIATIPKGEKKATFHIKIKTASFDFSKNYALGIVIKSSSAGTISGNYGKGLFRIIAKNAYDGVFAYKTSAATSLLPNRSVSTKLVTIGQYTVQIDPGLLSNYTNVVTYTVDPATNLVTVACPSLGVQTPQDMRSNWNPSTKVMTVFWKQANGARTFEETFTYTGSR
ncbi:MAG: DUF1735 domain-containing protein [Pedobacter sp.]|nr:MAG: DUF1735 domain-containing protein [Pedobacter sp.]